MKTEWTYVKKEQVWYDPNSLEDINAIRKADGKKELTSLDGYCMSSGCSCRYKSNPDCGKGIHICGLWKQMESDGVKRDFLHEILGI
jgi:hypothetical protein